MPGKPQSVDSLSRLHRVMAFDLGTQTGWAVWHYRKFYTGHQSFSSNRFMGGGMRFLQFRFFVCELIEKYNPQAIYYEEVRNHRGIDAAHIYGGFLGTLTATAEQLEIPYRGVPVGTWKKALTGNGRASKDDVMRAVKYHKKVNTQDEADALGVLLSVLRKN